MRKPCKNACPGKTDLGKVVESCTGVCHRGYRHGDERQAMKQQPSKDKTNQGYQVWHFALAVPALAVILQVMLGSLTPLPKEHNPYPTHYTASFHQNDFYYNDNDPSFNGRLPEIEILPLNLRGEMTGPLLASVIEQYFPESTEEHAADLRDTLPPCDNPRMIVIVPKDEENKPVF